MKKIINKILLLFAIISLIVPTTIVNATEENGTGNSGSTEGTVTTPAGGETSGDNQTGGGETTQTPTPTPETPKIEAKLDSLTVAGHSLKETFSKDNTNYTLTVKSDVQNVVINATAAEGVTVTGTGSHDLKEGKNSFTITALVGEEHTTYTITITRSTSDLSLKILSITGHPLNETFDPTILDYTVDVSYDTQSIIVKAGTNNADATQQISGNSNLKVGKNTVRIIVKNSSGESQEYRIIVNRLSEEEQEETTDDDSNSGTSSEIVTSSDVTPTIPEENNDDNDGDTLNYVLVVIFCILLLVIAGLGIYFYIRTGNSEKRKQKKIEKLKKKQAKIDQELTTLLPVITDEMIEEHSEKIEQAEEKFSDKDFEDTIELEKLDEEEIEAQKPRKRVEKNVLEDFDDLFLDE